MNYLKYIFLIFTFVFGCNNLFAYSPTVFDLTLSKLNLILSSNKNEKTQENFIIKVQTENFLTNDLIINDNNVNGFFTFDYSYLEGVNCQFLDRDLFNSLQPQIINFPIYLKETEHLIDILNQSFSNPLIYDVVTTTYGLNYYCLIKTYNTNQ